MQPRPPFPKSKRRSTWILQACPLTPVRKKPPVEGNFYYLENKVPEGAKKPEIEDLTPGKYLVNPEGKVALKIEENFPKGARVPPGTEVGTDEKLHGSQAQTDPNTYRGWHKTDNSDGIPAGKYLVDKTGEIKYLVDPAINGKLNARPDGYFKKPC